MVYVYLDEKGLEKTREKAKATAQKELHGDENKDNLVFYPDAEADIGELRLEEGVLKVDINVDEGDVNIGFISLDIPLNAEISVKVIDFYMKKLGRVKTILEATQNE